MARRSLSPLPILVGSAVDLGITIVLSTALGAAFAFGGGVASGALGDPQRADAAIAELTASPALGPFAMAVGLFGTVVGAATAARIARERYVLHGLGVGAFSVLAGLLALASGGPSLAEPFGTLGLVFALPAAALGGLLGSSTR